MKLHGAILAGALCALGPSASTAEPVNVNTASAAEIADNLKGIGARRAEAIVSYRSQHGPFQSADDLTLVKGVGPATIERNRGDIRLGDASP